MQPSRAANGHFSLLLQEKVLLHHSNQRERVEPRRRAIGASAPKPERLSPPPGWSPWPAGQVAAVGLGVPGLLPLLHLQWPSLGNCKARQLQQSKAVEGASRCCRRPWASRLFPAQGKSASQACCQDIPLPGWMKLSSQSAGSSEGSVDGPGSRQKLLRGTTDLCGAPLVVVAPCQG